MTTSRSLAAAVVVALGAMFGKVMEVGKIALAVIYAAFVGGFNAIRVVWNALPGVIGEAAIGAANLLIAAVETMDNGSLLAGNLHRVVPRAVIRGLQLGVGLKLIALNFRDEANVPRHPTPQLLSTVPELGNWRRILLVDDDEFNLMLTSVALRERGLQITEAASGENASVRHRERIVGSSFPGAWLSTRKSERFGGSSKIFKIALAALRLRSSASSPPSCCATSHIYRQRRNDTLSRRGGSPPTGRPPCVGRPARVT